MLVDLYQKCGLCIKYSGIEILHKASTISQSTCLSPADVKAIFRGKTSLLHLLLLNGNDPLILLGGQRMKNIEVFNL